MKLSNEEKLKVLQDIPLPEGAEFHVSKVDNVNHKPHPFTIGPKHIAHASDHHLGMLGESTLRAIPCAATRCGLPYEQHTSDCLAFIKITGPYDKPTDVPKLQGDYLKTVAAKSKEIGVDGFAFLKG